MKFQYRNHKEIYEIEFDDLRKIIKICDADLKTVNDMKTMSKIKNKKVLLEVIRD